MFTPQYLDTPGGDSPSTSACEIPFPPRGCAGGDFNTTSTEDAREKLLDRFARPFWTVAHDLGCGHDCRGTAYYSRDDTWSFLDMLLWSPARRGADATWWLRADSVQVVEVGAYAAGMAAPPTPRP